MESIVVEKLRYAINAPAKSPFNSKMPGLIAKYFKDDLTFEVESIEFITRFALYESPILQYASATSILVSSSMFCIDS